MPLPKVPYVPPLTELGFADPAWQRWFTIFVNSYGIITKTGYLAPNKNLADVNSASDSRDNLGLGNIATQDQDNVNITGGAISVESLATELFKVKEGTDCRQGVATLVSGSIIVPCTVVTASSRIYLTVQSPAGTVGSPYVSARVAGASFSISSTSLSDASTVAYLIVEPE